MQQDVQHVVMGAIQDVSHTTSVTTAFPTQLLIFPAFYSFLPPSFSYLPSPHLPIPPSLPPSQLMNYEAPSMVAGEDYKELEEEVLHTILTHAHPHTLTLTPSHMHTSSRSTSVI